MCGNLCVGSTRLLFLYFIVSNEYGANVYFGGEASRMPALRVSHTFPSVERGAAKYSVTVVGGCSADHYAYVCGMSWHRYPKRCRSQPEGN
jgi:hypothetical protein